ncbi:MAG: DUF2970 domain-containing protein [Colwellia sp.]|nr:DUF2970 domain-containing protein [Colwellia sp.]
MLTFIQNSLKDIFKSIAAVFLGGQSETSRKRDFSQGKLSQFILAGVVCVFIFITVRLAIVSLVIQGAQ